MGRKSFVRGGNCNWKFHSRKCKISSASGRGTRSEIGVVVALYYLLILNFVIAIAIGESEMPSGNVVQAPAAQRGNSNSNYVIYHGIDPIALLSGTLRSYQLAACDEEQVTIRCPVGTTISIQLAQYGKTAPVASLCRSSNPNIFPDLMDPIHANSNFSCQWPAAIQCRPSEFRSVIGCQDEVVQLSCNKSSRIAIYQANFGRTEYESMSCPQTPSMQEETCLASYATETVMQICHGKRRCALSADPATFGNPCKPESRMYLKVIHTCVPRKVLKEKYQGEPEPDEILDETDNNNEEDGNEGIIEQPSTWDTTRSESMNNNQIPQPKRKSRTSPRPSSIVTQSPVYEENPSEESRHLAKSSTVVGSGSHVGQETTSTGNGTNGGDIRVIYLISQGISAYDFLSRNSHTLVLYIVISVTSAMFLLFILLLISFACRRRRLRRRNARADGTSDEDQGTALKESDGTIRRSNSDTDELSVITDEYIPLPSILSRSDISTFTPAGGGTLNPNRSVVRFSNSRASGLSRKESDTNPRSLTSPHSNDPDLHFFYG